MGKIIDFPVKAAPVRWYIDINAEGKEIIRLRYVAAGEIVVCDCAHWRVVVEAATIDRLCVMLKEAEEQLAKEVAAGPAAERRWSRGGVLI